MSYGCRWQRLFLTWKWRYGHTGVSHFLMWFRGQTQIQKNVELYHIGMHEGYYAASVIRHFCWIHISHLNVIISTPSFSLRMWGGLYDTSTQLSKSTGNETAPSSQIALYTDLYNYSSPGKSLINQRKFTYVFRGERIARSIGHSHLVPFPCS